MKLKFQTKAIIGALFFGFCIGYGIGETAAIIFWVGCVLMLSLHSIEVKLNKLLDDRGIVVTDQGLGR
jgi:hypothetical protein